jgi:hypothetical protein
MRRLERLVAAFVAALEQREVEEVVPVKSE